ncbi:MAG: hypothetical protein K2F65_03525, partial [Eubacterium sp.]|nr:hypothetical protein [Eubacterium sp.]
TQDANGNYVLDVTKYSGGATLLKYEIDFDYFEANVQQSDDIYILSEGYANVIGSVTYGTNSYGQTIITRDTRIHDTAIFRTNYADTTQNHSASETGIMAVAVTSPVVKAYAYNNGTLKDCSETSSTDSLSVPINTDKVGFEYRLSNNSVSEIAPARLNSGAFGFKSGTDNYGLLTKRIIFSAKMFEDPKLVISSILLYTSGSSTPISVTKADFTKDANGNYVLTKEDGWASSGDLLNFQVNFDHFPANIASATADYSIRVEGEGNLAGFRDSLNASFATNYKDNTLNYAASDTDVARLYFEPTVPVVTSYAFWNNGTLKYKDADDTTGNTALDVPLNVAGVGFAYQLTNASISEINPGVFQSDDFARVSGSEVKGLIADKIILSEKLVEDSKTSITSILLYVSGSSTPITVTPADFTKDASGNYVLTKEDGWNGSRELLKFEINFEHFSANVAANSVEYFAAVEGTSNTIEKNRVDGIFKTNYTKSYATSYNKTSTEPAVLNVNIPQPRVNADVFMTGGSGTSYADPYAVPVNQRGVGFRYRLYNPGISTLVPGKFGSGTFVDVSGSDVEKFITEKIILSEKLVDDVSDINCILLYTTNNPSSPITVHVSDFTKDANGNYVLTKEDGWASSGGELLRFEIKFNSFKEETALSNDIYVMADGYTNVVKDVTVRATFNTDYASGNTNVYEDAKMTVSSIDPVLTGKSFCDDRNLASDPLNRATSTAPQTNIYGIGITNNGVAQNTVANQDEVRYEFYIENGATPAAGKGNLKIDLTENSSSPSKNVGNKGTAADPATKGFQAKTLTISGYDNLCDITEIKLYNYGSDPTGTPDVSIPITDIDISGNTFTIDITAYPEIDYLAYAIVEFDDFYGSVTSDNGKLTVKVEGTADWYEYLDAKLTFTPYNKTMQDKTVSVVDRVYIQRPTASLQVDVKYHDLASKALSNSSNRDGNQLTLGVPYDRDFRYEIKVGNDYISKLEDFDLTITLPVNNNASGAEANTGFHTTGFEVKANLIAQYEDLKSFTFYDVDDPTNGVKFIFDKANGKFVSEDGTKEYSVVNANGDIYVDENTIYNEWGIHNLSKVVINGTNFNALSNKEPNIINIYGFSDSVFGTHNVINVVADNWLGGIRQNANNRVQSRDSADAYISKMYYDATLVAGYRDLGSTASSRYDRVSDSFEHVRILYCHASTSAYWGDNSELDVGYKSIGSYMFDFRQYVENAANQSDIGTNYPENTQHYATNQEHRDLSYVYTQSFNTHAIVDSDIMLPTDHFDAYYLKVHPNAKDYLEKITVIRADGTVKVINKSEWAGNSIEKAADGSEYFVIDLIDVGSDEWQRYKSHADYSSNNPVTKITVSLNINKMAADENDKAL